MECEVPGCKRVAYHHGLCADHYGAAYKLAGIANLSIGTAIRVYAEKHKHLYGLKFDINEPLSKLAKQIADGHPPPRGTCLLDYCPNDAFVDVLCRQHHHSWGHHKRKGVEFTTWVKARNAVMKLVIAAHMRDEQIRNITACESLDSIIQNYVGESL